MAKQTSKPPANGEQPKQAESKQKQAPPAPIPAKGNGPLRGYPVPAGATHFRIHGVDTSNAITEALTLDNDQQGEPITRARVELLGDARWWDLIMQHNLSMVRCTFVRLHGDKLLDRLGQGPLWPCQRRETDFQGTPDAEAAPAAPSNGRKKAAGIEVPAGHGGELFGVLLQLQEAADARADRAARMHTELMRDFFTASTALVVGQQKESRRYAEQSRKRSSDEQAQAVKRAVEEALDERDDDDDDDDDDKTKTDKEADLVLEALKAAGTNVKPLVDALTRKLLA